MEEITFRQAEEKDKDIIWGILQQAIERRKNDGSNQWQDGYPNLQTVENDIAKDQGYVLTLNDEVITYAALIFNDEPAYENIKGEWLTNGDFMVVHRVAVSDKAAGKGIVKKFFGTLDVLFYFRHRHQLRYHFIQWFHKRYIDMDRPLLLQTKLNSFFYCFKIVFVCICFLIFFHLEISV